MYKTLFKRLFDILFSFIAIILLVPVYMIISIVVFCTMGSPVIFKQKRPGRNNELFTIYKFRTMMPEYSSDGTRLKNSDRITKVGAFLRSTYLDEIPEFFCVLAGKMSIIGPRPQLVEDMVFYTSEIAKRQDVTPGITGLAQSKGKEALGWEEKFKWDIEYTKNITLMSDVRILFDTVKMILSKKEPFDSSEDCGNYGDMLLKQGRVTNEEYEKAMNYARTLY